MARTYVSDLKPVLRVDCSEFGLCGGIEDQRPRCLGDAIRAAVKRYDHAQATGELLETPLWLEDN